MKKNVIAVCDTEGGYSCNFVEYLNSRKKLPFRQRLLQMWRNYVLMQGKIPLRFY